MTTDKKYPSIAHCAMDLIFHHKDWSNKQVADEVKRITGSRTGPGNISWYKGKLKTGELKMEKYIDFENSENVKITEAPIDVEKSVEIPNEFLVTDEDILLANGIQKLAFEFLKNKSEKTFNALYYRLKPGMVYHAMSTLKDNQAAEDVVSIAFTKIWTKIHQYNKQYCFSTWAYKIVYNEAMQHIRKNKVLVGIDSLGTAQMQDGGSSNEYNLLKYGASEESVSYNPEFMFDDNEDFHQEVYEKVKKEINDLSKSYKEIMIDRELNDMKYKHIADKYGININSVKTRIKRARMQIIDNNQEYYRIVQAKKKKKTLEDIQEDNSMNVAIERVKMAGNNLFDIL